jgi:acyl-CoA reductase-like NAD-dependent aldehyde dehydrogenase
MRGDEIKAIIEDEIHATSLWSSINLEDSILMIEEAASLITSLALSGTLPPSQDPASQVLVLTEPLGVILGIAPWNSPLILAFRSIIAAIAAGNTVILKGSELSPRTHYFVSSLFRDAGFPPGVCNFLLHRETDAALVFETIIDRHEVRKCNFTGSTPVGRSIASRAARALKPCLMELGGKNFAVVLKDADVEKAARMIAEGAFLNVRIPAQNMTFSLFPYLF